MKTLMMVLVIAAGTLGLAGCDEGNGTPDTQDGTEQDVPRDEGVQQDPDAIDPQPDDVGADEDTGEWDVPAEDVGAGDVLEDDPAVEDDAPDEADEPELPPGLVWVSIPADSFEMGCSPGDTSCGSDESPRHRVNVPAFEMTETEITQAQYEWVTGETPSHFTSCGASCPVEQVDWHQAKAFCEAIGGRLPSEAEWEYAARAGTTQRYYCGDAAACLNGIAWYSNNSGDTTHPVGEKTANNFGLYDMLGNVWEWVEDCYHSDYMGAPSDGGVWSGGDCGYRVLRGGSWNVGGGLQRVSALARGVPDLGRRDFGFRCARNF